ncbi:glycosyltransferase [Lacrimispora sp.]|uniref:glycosyltransferase n=1 Tax=Lacrimispora sp. TaxID=2719234 RepID=UPI002899AE88|nr:glycosyltransferase [Lacrimispora sp.]
MKSAEKKRIKLCHVIGEFVGGGVETVLLRYFSFIDAEKYELWVVAHGLKVQECADEFEKEGFHIAYLTPKRVSFYQNYKDFIDLFKREKFDIVHSHLTEWSCVPLTAALQVGIKVRISHSHMVEHPHGFINKIYYGTRLLWGRLVATHYFSCGKEAGEYLYGKSNVQARHVRVINNAFDISLFAWDELKRNEVRKELNIEPNTVCIGHVGRFDEQKNHKFIIEVFRKYHKMNPNSCLILIGKGHLEGNVSENIAKYDLTECVKLLGIRNDVNELYLGMDAFLFPSLYEGLGIVAIEAQVSNLPVLAANVLPHEAKIVNSMQFLDLNDGLDVWINKLNEMVNNNERKTMTDDIARSGFEITAAAKSLDHMYEVMRYEPKKYGKHDKC